MINQVILNGRLTRDVFVSDDGKWGSVSLACQREYKNKEGKYDADFIDVFLPNEKMIKLFQNYIPAGDSVVVFAHLQSRRVEVDGKNITRISVVADRISLSIAGRKPKANTNTKPEQAESSAQPDFNEFQDDGDDDLPF